MEVKGTKEFVNNRQPVVDADDVNAYVASLFEMLKEKARSAESRVKTEWIPVIKQWIEDIKDMMAPNVKPHKIPHLSKEVLIGLCRQYKVVGSNVLSAMMTKSVILSARPQACSHALIAIYTSMTIHRKN